jgi:hypothetical protein
MNAKARDLMAPVLGASKTEAVIHAVSFANSHSREHMADYLIATASRPSPARAIGDCVAHARFVQAGQRSSRRHSAHRRDGSVDAAMATSYGFMSERDDETATDVVSEH